MTLESDVVVVGAAEAGARQEHHSYVDWPALMLFAILGGAILVGQGVKSWVKDRVQEPRPFVVWLEKTHHVPVDEFYNLKRKDRGALVKEQLAEQQDIPKFLRKHWQKETGFAFPSGHTMFAASWALLGVGLLWPRRGSVPARSR